MSLESENQIQQWLKKLEQESWQLELLVSAFTIFLLIQAIGAFDSFLTGVYYEYDLSGSILSFVYLFLNLLGLAIYALAIFLVLHLMLRGFWIGTIGLRSVQSSINFDTLKYGPFFTEKIRKRVISLDSLVIKLDEICSLIFSSAFLVMSMLLAFGLYLLFLGVVVFSFSLFAGATGVGLIVAIIGAIAFFTVLITGLIYFLDYLTLGFFKKFQWFSKLYYPFYRLYGFITIAGISRSIYYYLISKFSKKKIRLTYLFLAVIMALRLLINFDQYTFFHETPDRTVLSTNYYDNLRPEKDYVENVAIQSDIITDGYIKLFLRYTPGDNTRIQSNCPVFSPLKEDGWNWRYMVERGNNNFFISGRDFANEDKVKLLNCLGSYYEISLNDSIVGNPSYYFYSHPFKGQKGIISMISTGGLPKGENVLKIRNSYFSDDSLRHEDLAIVPFWLN